MKTGFHSTENYAKVALKLFLILTKVVLREGLSIKSESSEIMLFIQQRFLLLLSSNNCTYLLLRGS